MDGFMKIFIIFFIIACVGIMIFSWIFYIKNYRSTIERAKKIDPSVKTLSDANHVLKKDIAESVGKDAVMTEGKMYCKHCGAEIDADSKFCNHCGQEQ